MPACFSQLLVLLALAGGSLGPGNHNRSLKMGDMDRSYLVHIPPKYDAKKPTPVVLVLHGAGTNGQITVPFCGLNKKADEAGFIAAYPNGTGLAGLMLIWNAGGFQAKGNGKADDVAFIAKVLDDLATVANVDPKRVYATGISNGGMMCYRLAAELSDRIAAIAPVAGTMAIDNYNPKRPVPVMHFHGTADRLVPPGGPGGRTPKFLGFKSLEDTIKVAVKANGCPKEPKTEKLPDKAGDGTTVTKKTYGPGKDGAEVVLFLIEGGGHTWPGQQPPVGFLGKSTKNISANDLIWEFFKKHPMK
ncbi:MAG: PHB depolymerase family esterase [Thermoguttaceae bacterium]|jgi:polyhydroxybutyrate depolymerase